MSDHDRVEVTTTEARAASKGRPVGVILAVSLGLVVVAFIVIFLMGGLAF